MLEKRVILIQLGLISILVLLIFGIIFLAQDGFIPKKLLPVIIPIIMLAFMLFIFILIANYQRSKIFQPFIRNQLNERGYHFISERPLKFREFFEGVYAYPSVSITINGMPLEGWKESFKYQSRNRRILHVKTEEGNFLLHTVIRKTWKDEFELEIIKKIRN